MIDYNIIKKTRTKTKYKGIDSDILSTIRWYPKIYENPYKFDFDVVKKEQRMPELQATKMMFQQ